MSDQALKDYFLFDDADLEANRKGQLTDKQKKYLSEDLRYTKMIGFGCSGVFFLGAVVVLIFSLTGFFNSSQSMSAALQSLMPTLALAAILGVLGIVMIVWTLSRSGAKSSLVLKRVVGPINIVAMERRHDLEHPTYTVHELHIGDLSFEVKQEVGNFMKQGDSYAVYYTEGQGGSERLIQSVERASK